MSIGNVPEWQRKRAERLDQICQWIEAETLRPAQGDRKGGKMAALAMAVEQFRGIALPNGEAGTKPLRISVPTLDRMYKRWLAHEKMNAAFVLGYRAANSLPVPDALLKAWQSALTNRGKQSAAKVYRDFCRDWKDGKPVPGMGTWQEWWLITYPARPLPSRAPDFSVSYEKLMKRQPHKVTRALGNFGLVAARDAIHRVTRNSSFLRPAEVLTCDDKDADQKAIDDVYSTKAICKPTMYFLMDVGPRVIVNFMVRPTKALAADVNEMIAFGLHSYGRGNGYPTHILFERGTTACSADREAYYNALFPGQLFVHRTGMIEGYAYAGQWKEESTGKPCSKGMIEAFMGKLDILLQAAAGKDGRTHLTRYVEDIIAIEEATGLKLDAPILRLSQFSMLVRRAVELYNADPHHKMQGFHQIDQIETDPGVWRDLPVVNQGAFHAAIG